MLFSKNWSKVSLGLPLTVTLPLLLGFLNWRWSPFVPTNCQPSRFKRSKISYTLYLFISHIVTSDGAKVVILLLFANFFTENIQKMYRLQVQNKAFANKDFALFR